MTKGEAGAAILRIAAVVLLIHELRETSRQGFHLVHSMAWAITPDHYYYVITSINAVVGLIIPIVLFQSAGMLSRWIVPYPEGKLDSPGDGPTFLLAGLAVAGVVAVLFGITEFTRGYTAYHTTMTKGSGRVSPEMYATLVASALQVLLGLVLFFRVRDVYTLWAWLMSKRPMREEGPGRLPDDPHRQHTEGDGAGTGRENV